MIQCDVIFSSSELNAIGDDALVGTTRSIELLRTIDNAIAQLCYDQNFFGMIGKMARFSAESIKKSTDSTPIDKDGSTLEKLLTAQKSCERLFEVLVARKKSAEADSRLTADDGVADEFSRTADVVIEAHNALNDLRWAIDEHDADLESVSGAPFSDPEALRAYLNKR